MKFRQTEAAVLQQQVNTQLDKPAQRCYSICDCPLQSEQANYKHVRPSCTAVFRWSEWTKCARTRTVYVWIVTIKGQVNENKCKTQDPVQGDMFIVINLSDRCSPKPQLAAYWFLNRFADKLRPVIISPPFPDSVCIPLHVCNAIFKANAQKPVDSIPPFFGIIMGSIRHFSSCGIALLTLDDTHINSVLVCEGVCVCLHSPLLQHKLLLCY